MAVVGTGKWAGIAYGNGTYVTVAEDGYVATSTDGVNWSMSDKVLNKYLSAICYGNGLFLTVSSAGFRAVSVDGVTWTNRAVSSSDNGYQSIVYGNDRFVFGSYQGKLFMTTDGTKLYSYKAPRAENFTGIAYRNGEFIAVSKNGYQYYYTSSDGISWAQNEYDANNTTRPVRLVFGKDKFVAIDVNQKLFINSVDGRTWSTGIQVSTETGAEILWDNIRYDKGYFIAYGHIYAGSSHSTSYITASVDGITWRDPIQLVDEHGVLLNLWMEFLVELLLCDNFVRINYGGRHYRNCKAGFFINKY